MRLVVRKIQWFALPVAVGLLAFGCGAPARKPSDVGDMFQREPQKLREVAAKLCDSLASATGAPSLRSVKLSASDCGAVDQKTQELSQTSELDFVKIDEKRLRSLESGPASDPTGVLFVQTRGQVWLNHSMLRLAQKLIGAIRDAEANGTSAILPNLNASAKDDSIVKLEFKELKKTTLDETATRLSSAVELNGRGAVTINNVITTEGRIFDDSIALEINTREDAPFEKSLLQRLNAVVLIIPYGNDVYVDMVIELRIHSLGVDKLVSEQVSAALSTGVKAGLDALIKLD